MYEGIWMGMCDCYRGVSYLTTGRSTGRLFVRLFWCFMFSVMALVSMSVVNLSVDFMALVT